MKTGPRARAWLGVAAAVSLALHALPAESGGRVPGGAAMYVVPADRVLAEIGRLRGPRAVTLHAEIDLTGELPPGWPAQIEVDLHPEYGVRVTDLQGGKWVIRRERVVASSRADLPDWLPQLEVLVLPSRERLEIWLSTAGVDLQRNVLGRCGASDCFVVGGRDPRSAQLWVDKDSFELRRWVSASGRSCEFTAYREWGRIKFPSEISVLYGEDARATLSVRSLEPAPALGERDFSRTWTDR